MKKKTNLIKLQEMLMDEMERVCNVELDSGMYKREIERSKTLTGNALNYIKSIQTSLRIKEYADATKIAVDEVNKELGNLND